MANIKARNFTMGLAIFSIFIALFLAFNGQGADLKIGMLAYAVAAAIVVVLIKSAGIVEFNLADSLFDKDALIGLLAGGIFIMLNNFDAAIALGAPVFLLALGAFGITLGIVVVAPIVEELLFRGVLLPFLENTFNWIAAVIISSLAFATYHFAAYGGFLGLKAAPGLFIGAFVFSVVAALMVGRTKKVMDNPKLERAIYAHALFNAYLLNQVLSVVVI